VKRERSHPLPGTEDWFRPTPSSGPELRYGEDGVTLDYGITSLAQQAWIRVTFDRLDAVRVCRGEFSPYESDRASAWEPLTVVRNSRWLAERHDYERRHYGTAYNFGGDVDEMLTEFEHYVFEFHDQFVEAIAGGLHVERWATEPIGPGPRDRPGWAHLPDDAETDVVECAGIPFSIRTLGVEPRDVVKRSLLCEQVVIEVAPMLDGRVSVSRSLCVRTRDGATVSRWRAFAGKPIQFDGVATIDDVMPLIEQHAHEIRARRTAMGRG
jgi:hypothetical protein